MKVSKIVALAHKWVTLFVGIQIVLWVTGGVVMSWFHITTVRGEHNIDKPAIVSLNDPDRAGGYIMPPQQLMESFTTPVIALNLHYWLERLVYVAEFEDGSRNMLDAATGVRIDIDLDQAVDVAMRDFSGKSTDLTVDYIEQPNGEYRGQLPVWQVMMGDGEDTRIYVSPEDGRVVARRNATWRLYDFFWMLHIMDYENSTDFNNTLIRVASAIGLVAAFSGFILLFYRFRRRDFQKLTGKN